MRLLLLLGSSRFPEGKCLSPQEKKQGVKEVLEWRKEELKFLKKEKKCVHSLLKLCGEVKHLVKGDSPGSPRGPNGGSPGQGRGRGSEGTIHTRHAAVSTLGGRHFVTCPFLTASHGPPWSFRCLSLCLRTTRLNTHPLPWSPRPER